MRRVSNDGGGLIVAGTGDPDVDDAWVNASRYARTPVRFTELRVGQAVELEVTRATTGRVYVEALRPLGATPPGAGDAGAGDGDAGEELGRAALLSAEPLRCPRQRAARAAPLLLRGRRRGASQTNRLRCSRLTSGSLPDAGPTLGYRVR